MLVTVMNNNAASKIQGPGGQWVAPQCLRQCLIKKGICTEYQKRILH